MKQKITLLIFLFLFIICFFASVIPNCFGQTVLISPTGDGGFETGTTYAANGWTSVNTATNFWVLDNVAPAFAGSRGAHISQTGAAYNYSISPTARTSHFYRDVVIPAGATAITLSFQWKGSAEGGYDRMMVYTAPTTVTPAVNVPASSSQALPGATLAWVQAGVPQIPYTTANIVLPNTLAGTTVRLIFTWQNDVSGGAGVGIAVDNISLVYTPPLISSPGGVSTGLQTWIRADIGVTSGGFGTPITAWANQFTTGAGINVHGAPKIYNSPQTIGGGNQSYNYNPFVYFEGLQGTWTPSSWSANRQFLTINGFSGVSGPGFKSLFWALETEDLTRVYEHLGTVDNITHNNPGTTLHGGINGTTSALQWGGQDLSSFGTGAWRRNDVSVAYDAMNILNKSIISAVSTSGGIATLNTFLGGQQDNSTYDYSDGVGYDMSRRDWIGPAAEIIGYTSVLTATESLRVGSYLAVKYGMTMVSSNYLATNSTTIYTTAVPYNNNIIGIGRDDIESLNQKQSHNDDDTVRIYMNNLLATNAANTAVFSSNISYVMSGANTGKMCATIASNMEVPAACGLYSRLEREWKVTRTNMAQNFNMDFKLNTCGAPGSVSVADLRLLVDDDGDFGNGGTTCYSNATNPGLFTYGNPTITITGINAAMIPNASTKYITIGSVNVATPLPVELLFFDAKLNSNRGVDLTWSTASETNTDVFIVEKSADNTTWSKIGTVDAAGNSTTQLNYYLEDKAPFMGVNYYRLKQVNLNGDIRYSETRAVDLVPTEEIVLFPNPATDEFFLQGKHIDVTQIQVFNSLGQSISIKAMNKSEDMLQIDCSELDAGIYIIRILNSTETVNLQFIKTDH